LRAQQTAVAQISPTQRQLTQALAPATIQSLQRVIGVTATQREAASDLSTRYSQKRLAVALNGGLVAQMADADTTELARQFRFNVYALEGAGVRFVDSKGHAGLSTQIQTQNSAYYDAAFAPDGSALWAVAPVSTNSRFYDIVRFDTATWTGTDFSHFGQLELNVSNVQEKERSMIAVVKTALGEKALARKEYSQFEASVFELDPDTPGSPSTWRFETYQQPGNSAFSMRTIVKLLVRSDLVYAVGWAKVNSVPTDIASRAAVIVANADDHSLVRGPYFVDTIKTTTASYNNGPFVPQGILHAKLSADGNTLFISSDRTLAKIELATGAVTVGDEIPLSPYPTDRIRDLTLLGGEPYALIERRIAQYTVESRKLVRLGSDMVRTTTAYTLPQYPDFSDWREHPTRPNELVVSSQNAEDLGVLHLWSPPP
jgi:hypothetical protein